MLINVEYPGDLVIKNFHLSQKCLNLASMLIAIIFNIEGKRHG